MINYANYQNLFITYILSYNFSLFNITTFNSILVFASPIILFSNFLLIIKSFYYFILTVYNK